jgi:hypothetical protein
MKRINMNLDKDKIHKKTNPVTNNECTINTHYINGNADISLGRCRECSQVIFKEVYFATDKWSGYCKRFRRRVCNEDVCLPAPPIEKPTQGKSKPIQLSLFNL